jgi:hypothetical protein
VVLVEAVQPLLQRTLALVLQAKVMTEELVMVLLLAAVVAVQVKWGTQMALDMEGTV